MKTFLDSPSRALAPLLIEPAVLSVAGNTSHAVSIMLSIPFVLFCNHSFVTGGADELIQRLIHEGLKSRQMKCPEKKPTADGMTV
jgi:hypothetical protein